MTDEAVVISCPKCPAKLKLKGDVAGKKIKCPKCDTVFKIGQRKSKSSAAPATPPDTNPSPTETRSRPQKSPSTAAESTSGRTQRSRKPQSKAAPANRSPTKKRRPKKKKPVAQETWEDDGYDDFSNENYGADGFGGAFEDDFADDGFDDGYEDFGATKSLPSRKTKKKKKKKKSGSKSKKSSSDEENGLQTKLHSMGFLGWLLCGGTAGVVATGLTTLTGYTDFGFLTSIMSIVTGSMVGAAVRFAAQPNYGWGPGIVGVLIALIAILVGKTCSWYVWFEQNSDPEDEWTLRDDIESNTSESALMSSLASDIQAAWLAEGKITEAEIEQHWESAYEDLPDDWDEDAEFEETDYSLDFLPIVWAEATKQWQAKSDEERMAIKDEAIRNVKIDWLGDEGADMPMAEAEKAANDDENAGNLQFAFIAAVGNCFLPLHALFCFCSGLYGAFKLSAGMIA